MILSSITDWIIGSTFDPMIGLYQRVGFAGLQLIQLSRIGGPVRPGHSWCPRHQPTIKPSHYTTKPQYTKFQRHKCHLSLD